MNHRHIASLLTTILGCAACSWPLCAQIDFGDDESTWANDGECDDPRFEGEGVATDPNARNRGHDATDCRDLLRAGRISLIGTAASGASLDSGERTGELAAGDTTLSEGEYSDRYTFAARAGQSVTIELRSAEFDTYLIVRPPTGDSLVNDDYNGDNDRSVVEIAAPVAGEYEVFVTSFAARETGPYSVNLRREQTSSAASTPETTAPSPLFQSFAQSFGLARGEGTSSPVTSGDMLAALHNREYNRAFLDCGTGEVPGRRACLDGLLAASATINFQDEDGMTWLMHAALLEDVILLEALLAHGADYTLRSKDDWTVLRMVQSIGQTRAIEALRAAGARE